MSTAIICTMLLGILVFGLGLLVSLGRGQTNTNIGHSTDPTDPLHKRVRAHANACEYAPMLAVLMLFIGSREPSLWVEWTMVLATVARYLHAGGMIFPATLDKPNPMRFAGALLTYVAGLVLCVVGIRYA